MTLTRRRFMASSTSLAFANLLGCASSGTYVTAGGPGASLIPDPNGLVDLPPDFSYRIISSYGDLMSDGYRVPDRADGMGCIALDNHRVALIRNHELKAKHYTTGGLKEGLNASSDQVLAAFDYTSRQRPLTGGTTTLIYDVSKGELVEEFRSLTGTIRNCAGGTTPWGTWLSCEEDVTNAGKGVGQDHGWVFEVHPSDRSDTPHQPIKAMGRFNHEAAAVDPNTGIVYLTEDRNNSLLYRYIPDQYGKLSQGGRLQALAFSDNQQADTRNWHSPDYEPGSWRSVKWVDLDEVESPKDDLRDQGGSKGAAIFARGEGIHWGENEAYFCCTSGGAARLGQIMRYIPSPAEGTDNELQQPGRLQLFFESDDPKLFNFGDNLTATPSGDLLVCEDQYGLVVDNHLRLVSSAAEVTTFAKLHVQTEWAGACFSPDGSTLFVNLYHPTRTLAITGPW